MTRKNDGWSRKYALDESYFSEINTEDRAYWLGFLMADGYLYPPLYKTSLKLAAQDADHLEKFRVAVGYQKPVRMFDGGSGNGNKSHQCCLEVSSMRMMSDLQKHGLTQAKSFTATPWNGPYHLLRHYWRGVFDGDGCLHKLKSKANCWQLHLVGTREMCEGFLGFVRSEGAITAHGRIFRVRWSGVTKPKAIAELLYKDAKIFLERKYQLYRNM